MNIRFIYPKKIKDLSREKIILKVCNIIEQEIKLPSDIIIEFKNLEKNIYAETILHGRNSNRIVLNYDLSIQDSVRPLVHELIHLNQIYTGMLSCGNRGSYKWLGETYSYPNIQMLNYKDYMLLPWEQDVSSREKILLLKVVENKKLKR